MARIDLYVGSLDNNVRKLVARIDNSAVYASPGYLLFRTAAIMFGQVFDAAHLKASGQPFLVAEHVGQDEHFQKRCFRIRHRSYCLRWHSLAEGTLTWLRPRWQATGIRWARKVIIRIFASRQMRSRSPLQCWTPGRAMSRSGLSISNAAAGAALPGKVQRSTRALSGRPMAHSLCFGAVRGIVEFYQRSAGGGGNEQVLLSYQMIRAAGIQASNLVNTDWSPDGKSILFSVPAQNSGLDLWLLPLTGDRKAGQVPGIARG